MGGFRLAMLGLNAMRPIVAARGIGLAKGTLMYATEYVQQRQAFGHTIADFQGIQWEIAKVAVDIEAARLLTYRSAWLADQGKFTKEYVPYLSMAKYHATELAVRASGLAVQLLGAAGYMEDHPTELWYRDARQLTIVEGTPGAARAHRPGCAEPRPVVGLNPCPRRRSTGRAGARRRPARGLLRRPGRLARRAGPGCSTATRSSADEAEVVLGQVLSGEATPAQIAGLAVALRSKGESVAEMTGFVRAMVAHAVPLPLPAGTEVVDTCGTGGDRLRSINVSTIASLVVAARVPRCKHGGRASSSAVGAADVLEALGAVADLGPQGWPAASKRSGWGSASLPGSTRPCASPAGPPGARHPDLFNFLGPLANPARARFQVIGVSDPAMADKMLGVLAANGTRRAMVVHGDDGLDELSHHRALHRARARPHPRRLGPGRRRHRLGGGYRVDPSDLGLARATLEDLRGGDATVNAEAIRRVVAGDASPHRDIALLNTAAALVVVGRARTWPRASPWRRSRSTRAGPPRCSTTSSGSPTRPPTSSNHDVRTHVRTHVRTPTADVSTRTCATLRAGSQSAGSTPTSPSVVVPSAPVPDDLARSTHSSPSVGTRSAGSDTPSQPSLAEHPNLVGIGP